MKEEVSGLKFHSLYGRHLAVALEATFAGDEIITVLVEELNFPDLIYPALVIRQTREEVRRVYYPAIADGDMAGKTDGQIIFLPWVDETEVRFHRLVFRLRPAKGKNNKFPWVRFGRFGEDDAFGFIVTRSPYIALDFMSKRADEFVPLYVKTQDGSRFVYFVLSAEAGEEAVTLKVQWVNESEVPLHLAEAKPD